MTIVVGYVPTPEGEAALTQAIAEAKKSNNHLLVINSSKGDAWWTTATPRSRTSRESSNGLQRKASATPSRNRFVAMTRRPRSWMPQMNTTRI